MTHELTIEYGDDLLLALNLSAKEFNKEARFVLFAKLYELGRISSGKAAHYCGMARVDFLLSLARIGVPMSNLSAEDLEEDMKFARG
ncbi:UPF0175 family protein [bacterium]|nr:MAG: UPF0175 family protein [bacterium]RIK63960.1 MAG: hypothetical protein DCC64_06025 [Planctomycetota bacterium]